MKKIVFFFGIIMCFFVASASHSFAVKEGWTEGTKEHEFVPPPQEELVEQQRPGDRTVRQQIVHVVNYFLTFLGLIAVVAIIYFGFLFLVSGGNDENIEKGKKGIIWVTIGILVILFAYVFVVFLISSFGSAKGMGMLPRDTDTHIASLIG